MSADSLIMASLRKQTERRHLDWFDLNCHPKPTGRELLKLRKKKEQIEKLMKLAAKTK